MSCIYYCTIPIFRRAVSSTLDLITCCFWSVGITANLAQNIYTNKSIRVQFKVRQYRQKHCFLCTGQFWDFGLFWLFITCCFRLVERQLHFKCLFYCTWSIWICRFKLYSIFLLKGCFLKVIFFGCTKPEISILSITYIHQTIYFYSYILYLENFQWGLFIYHLPDFIPKNMAFCQCQ